jgi:hypothetical protein
MEINKNHANEPAVGISFFESIPPVGLQDYSSRWKNSTPPLTNSIENKQTTHGNIKLNETEDKAVVKGFGGTALFTAGLLIATKQQGVRIRLDDGISKNGTISNAENICKRNPTIVRKYCNEELTEGRDTSCKTKTIEDENTCVPKDFPDEIFASDYPMKSGNLNKIVEEYVQ